ncbi:hypothetical protein QA601_04420 [Chitinispirillales bacterium ANBcel5]|uniref:hypothetical protein n=1 Tax=Cellulosispirillum alkaliphilum TaxID=3039283 RepID=UPI002A501835|nr:hypothetical protein [Chitinispirillales bacterium ANBcel5]
MKNQLLCMLLTLTSVIYAHNDSIDVKDLPKIELRNDRLDMSGFCPNTGRFHTSIINRHYYCIGDTRNKRVNYFATNLAEELKPVPEAYSTLQTYKTNRILELSLGVTGLAVGITGLAIELNAPKDENGDIPLPNFTVPIIGLGIALTSWIPRIIYRGKVEESVSIYNSAISDSD